MYLEAVTVCVGYSDFLAQFLLWNKNQFNRLVVVSDTKDKATHDLCEYHNVECVKTDVFYEDGAVFNKAKGINEGLKRLSMNGWVLHLDSDIILPPITRSILNKLTLDPKAIYGVDRFMICGYDNWLRIAERPPLQHSGWVFVNPHMEGIPMGFRLSQFHGDGYEPIGFFQLWNANGSGVRDYPLFHGAADRTDVLFAKRWKPGYRRFIPDFVVYHLESEISPMSMNWFGRKSAPFTINETLRIDRLNRPFERFLDRLSRFYDSVVNPEKYIQEPKWEEKASY